MTETSTDTTTEPDEGEPEGDGTDGEGLVDTIRRVAREVVSEMMGDGNPAPKPAGDPEARTWTPREIQEAAAAEMRRVQDELRAKAKAKPKPAPAKAETKAEGGDGGAGSTSATTAPSNPKSWRTRLWGTA